MAEFKVVQTSSGSVKGIKKTSAVGIEYYNFQGIPYAKPPVGKLRFRDPQPFEPVSDVIIDATAQSPACGSFNNILGQVVGDDNCLHVNIFTKQFTTKTPVMVWIHGGAFMHGSSGTEMYGPDYLLQKDIIFVSFNYRLGAFGFLSFDEPELEIPGNAGLKDQSLALKWVKENISAFGGDPDNITLFGESAGGASVHFQMISDMSANLFNRAIVMSGCALNNWSIVPRNHWAERLAKALGWKEETGKKEALRILEDAAIPDIVKAQLELLTDAERKDRILFAFGPIVEPYVGTNCFIPTSPLEMCRTAWSENMDILIGGTSDEGLYCYREVKQKPEILAELGDFEYLVPVEIEVPRDSQKGKDFGLLLKNYYYPQLSPSLENIGGYVQLMTDKLFWHGLHRTILSRQNRLLGTGLTYLYRFSVDSPTQNHYKNLMCGKQMRGCCHADDLSYIFKNLLGKVPAADTMEYRVIQDMVGLLTQFAITGNPNIAALQDVVWKPVNTKSPPFTCLNVNEKGVAIVRFPETDRMALWDKMYEPPQLF